MAMSSLVNVSVSRPSSSSLTRRPTSFPLHRMCVPTRNHFDAVAKKPEVATIAP